MTDEHLPWKRGQPEWHRALTPCMQCEQLTSIANTWGEAGTYKIICTPCMRSLSENKRQEAYTQWRETHYGLALAPSEDEMNQAWQDLTTWDELYHECRRGEAGQRPNPALPKKAS